MALARAASSTMPPRDVFTRRAPSFIRASSRSPISASVSGVRGRWRDTKSACTRSASRVGISSTPISLARSLGTYGSNAMTRMPKAAHRWATIEPTLPRPTTPSVLPASSTPWWRSRSHRPAFSAVLACGMFRAWASMSATACSAAETMFDCGAFTTMTPRLVAASTSTLSRPIPALAMTFRFSAASITSAVTLVCDRTMSASYGPISSARSPRASSGRTSTWKSFRKSPRPRSDSGSVTRTRMRLFRGGEDVLGGCHGRAPLDRVSQLVQGELDGGQPSDHVETFVVPEVADAEDLALERTLTRGQDDAVVGPDSGADPVGVDALGGTDRGYRPGALAILAEQIQPEGSDAFLDRARQHAVPSVRCVRPVLVIQAKRGLEPLHHRDRGGPRTLRVLQPERLPVRGPVEIEPRVLRLGLRGPRRLGDGGEREARRGRQGLLGPADRDVDAPTVEVERHGPERGHRVHDDHGAGILCGAGDRFDVMHDPRRGFALREQHGLGRGLRHRGPNVGGPHRFAPLVVDRVDVEPVGPGDLGEPLREVPGQRYQHRVARREAVGDGRLETPGARGGEDQDVRSRAVQPLEALGHLLQHAAEAWTTVVDERAPLGQIHLGRDRCGSGGQDDLGSIHDAARSWGRIQHAMFAWMGQRTIRGLSN